MKPTAASHNKETGELDVESCLDDFLGMYAAGHTTTLATVCWTMSELIRNTAVMERLVGEVVKNIYCPMQHL